MLTGDLRDFSLREILQFLASTASSGVLELRNVESHAGVAFHEGGICVALLDMDGIRGLASRMIRAGGVDVPTLCTLGEEHSGDAIDLAAVLAAETAAHGSAAEVFREHTYEILGWLLRRDGAQFLFESSDQLDDWPHDTVALVEAFEVVDGRDAEWDELADTISDLTRICSPVPDAAIDDISLDAEQWRVLSLVDGRRTLKDLVELSGIGHLETFRHLQLLVDAGLMELVTAGASSSLDGVLAGLGALRPRGAGATAALSGPVRTPAGAGERQDRVAPPMSLPTPTPPGSAATAEQGASDVNGAGADVVGDVDDIGVLPAHANRVLFERLMDGGGTDS